MGYVKVKAKFVNPQEPGKAEEVELLADSGAMYTLLPLEVVSRLSIKAEGKRKFRLANGTVIEREYGIARVELPGEVGATRVILGQKEDIPLLGVTTLEELGLKINPATGQLEPLELLLL